MAAEPSDFRVAISQESHQQLLRLLGALAERLGRLPDPDRPRYADGRDLVGAALAVTERRPEIFEAVATEVRRSALRRGARAELLAICGELDRLHPRIEDVEVGRGVQSVVRDLREIAVSIAVRDEPVGTAARLQVEAARLAELARDAGSWSEPLDDLVGGLEDLRDALHPIG